MRILLISSLFIALNSIASWAFAEEHPLVPIKNAELVCGLSSGGMIPISGVLVFAGLKTDKATIWFANKPQDKMGYLAGEAPIIRQPIYKNQLFLQVQDTPEPGDDSKETWRLFNLNTATPALYGYKGWDLKHLGNHKKEMECLHRK